MALEYDDLQPDVVALQKKSDDVLLDAQQVHGWLADTGMAASSHVLDKAYKLVRKLEDKASKTSKKIRDKADDVIEDLNTIGMAASRAKQQQINTGLVSLGIDPPN